jgi:hypothetical protein
MSVTDLFPFTLIFIIISLKIQFIFRFKKHMINFFKEVFLAIFKNSIINLKSELTINSIRIPKLDFSS